MSVFPLNLAILQAFFPESIYISSIFWHFSSCDDSATDFYILFLWKSKLGKNSCSGFLFAHNLLKLTINRESQQ
jgi:hypothetical protein